MTAGAMGRRERNKAEKRARILASAAHLLQEHGFDRMTMAQVAADADVAIGTVFQYAATKAELLMMVTAHQWSGRITPVPSSVDDPVTEILRLLEPLAAATRREPEVTMAIARELLFGGDGPHRTQVVELVAELESAVADVLRAAGGDDEGRVQAAARLVVSGALLEVNRSRTGRATESSMDLRLQELVTIVTAGTTGTRTE